MSVDLRPSRLGPLDIARLGSTGLRTRPLRTVLAALGIAIGVAAMVAIVGISASSGAEITQRINDLGPNLLRVSGAPLPQGNGTAKLPSTTLAAIARIGPVVAAAETGSLPLSVYRNNHVDTGDTGSIDVVAADRELMSTLHATVASGHWFTRSSVNFPSVVLGSAAARHLGIDRTGVDVLLGGERVAVAGVLDPVPLAAELNSSALVGWQSARTYLRFSGRPTTVYVRVVQSDLKAVNRIVPRSVVPTDPADVSVAVPADAIAAREAATSTLSGLLLGLAGVALVIGGIGIANTMVVSVLERRSEIGLRRALGATRGQIRVQFIGEAVLLSLIGGVTGAVSGTLVTGAYATARGWPIEVPLWVSVSGVAATAVIGGLSGLYPAVRASRTSPTTALATL